MEDGNNGRKNGSGECKMSSCDLYGVAWWYKIGLNWIIIMIKITRTAEDGQEWTWQFIDYGHCQFHHEQNRSLLPTITTLHGAGIMMSIRNNYTLSQKGCHPNHGYNFVNSWSICKILSLLQTVVNFQQNSYRVTHHTLSMLLHYLGKLKNQKLALCMHVKRLKCDFLSPMQQISVKCHDNKCKD